ncbi:MAG: deoxyribodipyrimidine photo-lyase [Parvularculaceae bacterium]|nr:deoxyribodipyrimidine photo-lyase [Parvularculaceae bacterium]
MAEKPALFWFRRDLRTEDNPAFAAALGSGRPVAALYIHDDEGMFAPGGAQRWFLHQTIAALEKRLSALGVPLLLRSGGEKETLVQTVEAVGAAAVFWNRRYAAEHVERDKAIKAALTTLGVEVTTFNGSLLREPWEIATKSETPFKVFTPFWNTLRALGPSRTLAPGPAKTRAAPLAIKSERLGDWGFIPTKPDWAREFHDCWTAGEDAAQDALRTFLDDRAATYDERRNFPAERGTSRLSPHLAVGSISPLKIWTATHAAIEAGAVPSGEGYKFLSEIAWREFSYHLLFHNPQMPTEPLQPKFAAFAWRDSKDDFRAWTRGETGVPIVDAGMRELWRTGWMHNRVRMIVASFLVKNLLLPWRWGERWFWDTLVDADPANNTASWQWVAGCGADAAPYFRIFNPVTQAEKFDPQGSYIRRFAPHLAATQKGAKGATEGGLPPIVDLAASRTRALEAYHNLKSAER